MSFALVAVILLLVAGAGTALLASFREQDGETERSEAYIDGLLRFAADEAASAQKEAHALALEAAKQNPSSNETVLMKRFEGSWSERARSLYPKQVGAYLVRIEKSDLILAFLRLTADELPQFEVPSGKESNQLNSTIPAFLTVSGILMLNVSCERGFILKRVSMDERVYSPIPLLQNRLEAFLDEVEDDKGNTQNIVRYELSALVQKRALEGKDLFGATFSRELLSQTDVENAVALALIVEQVRLFRTYDQQSGHAALVSMACSEEALTETERILASNGDMDPAELFLNLIGEDRIDPRVIVAQSLYAATDVLVLRWLDYLQIADIARFLEQQLDRLTITIARVLGAIFGFDPVNEMALDYIRGRMASAGYDEQSYRYLFSGSPDAAIEISGATVEFIDSEGSEVRVSLDGSWAIDFPKVDLFSTPEWERFFVNYKTNTFEMAEMLEQFIKSVALSVAESLGPQGCELELDPLDGQSFIDEVTLSVTECLAGAEAVVSRAFESGAADHSIHDGMAVALVRFIETRWSEIFQVDSSVDWAIEELAHNIASTRLSGYGLEDIENCANQICDGIHTVGTFGVEESIRGAIRGLSEERIETFASVFSQVTLQGAAVAFSEAVARLAIGLVQSVPGVEAVVKGTCLRMLSDLAAGCAIRGDAVVIPIRGIGPLELETENGEVTGVELVPHIGLDSIGTRLSSSITYPDMYRLGQDDYPNLHVTDIGNLTLCPFQSQFEITYAGSIGVTLMCNSTIALMASGNPILSAEAPIAAHFTLFTSSGWPLQGVEYAPTMTLVKQIAQFLQAIWDGICGALSFVWDGLNTIGKWVVDALSTVISWAMKVIEFLADALAKVIQAVKDLIFGAIGGFAEWLGQTISSTLGKVAISFSFFGIAWLIETDVTDIAYGRSRDYLRVTGTFGLCGITLSGSMRIVNIHDKGTDILFNGTAAGDGWMVEASMDPLMFVTSHFLSVVGTFSGFVIELSMPKVVEYDRLTFSLGDIPVIGQLLSRIPLPVPGLTGSIDAGFDLLYDSPIDDHVVINEVELNPSGPDEGKEWIELYNPTGRAVSLEGWCFETKHGIQEQCYLANEVVPARGRFVHVFDHLTLDNGGESGTPLGESIVLHDSTGSVVDSTAFLTDYYGDDRTWQRRSDGADSWKFKASTCGSPNSHQIHPQNDVDVILHEFGDAAVRGMAKAQINGSFSIDTLANLIRCVIDEVVDSVIDTLGDSIVEVALYVELRLQDYSQAVGGSFRLSLSVTGDFVREGLRWIADAVRTALGSYGNPSAVSPKAHSIDELADDVWIKFGAYVGIGLPAILGSVGPERFSFGGEAHVNLASFMPSGAGHQNWSIAFGALFKAVPGRFLSSCLSVDADHLVDCWLLYATIHAPGYGSESV
ncbi:MAG: lamin tail domain-containing protein [Methanomassiliicoccales archaeon]|nr:lamin tail domain-containing protein [Methanomassiliicoccales archaeon]